MGQALLLASPPGFFSIQLLAGTTGQALLLASPPFFYFALTGQALLLAAPPGSSSTSPSLRAARGLIRVFIAAFSFVAEDAIIPERAHAVFNFLARNLLQLLGGFMV